MTHHPALSVAALLLLAMLASHPRARLPEDTTAASEPEVHRLKSAYPRCDQSATERLLAWWRAERSAAVHQDEQVATPGDRVRKTLAASAASNALCSLSGRAYGSLA